MKIYNEIENYYEPRESLSKLNNFTPEMTVWESGFLCGLLKKLRPSKILEVGVAEGGTTTLITKCMEMIKCSDYKMYSVDLNEKFYRDRNKNTGYQFSEACEAEIVTDKNHIFYLGNVLPEVIDKIGSNIDFLILDTVHSAPGELLDLILSLPYLSPNATVCFHDMALDHNIYKTFPMYINKLLFDVVKGTKYFNITGEKDRERQMGLPNIGAFSINNETIENVRDLFSTFSFPWSYMPDPAHIMAYKQKYAKLYPAEYVELFDFLVSVNENTINRKAGKKNLAIEEFKLIMKKKNLYLYGAGERGKKFLNYFHSAKCDIKGFIVSDEYKTNQEFEGKKVYTLSEVKQIKENIEVLVTSTFPEVIMNLEKNNLKYYIPDEYICEHVNIFNCIIQ